MDDVKITPEDYKSSHKFYGNPLAEALWECSLESWQDDEAGESESAIGWNALFHFEQSQDVKVFEGDGINSDPPVTVTVPRGSYILTQISSGAVDVASFEYQSAEALWEWSNILSLAYDETDDPDFDRYGE
jgi:hypothetical protein